MVATHELLETAAFFFHVQTLFHMLLSRVLFKQLVNAKPCNREQPGDASISCDVLKRSLTTDEIVSAAPIAFPGHTFYSLTTKPLT